MIEFSIPGFFGKDAVNRSLLTLMEIEPEKFHEDIKITSCYDSFPCVWNGGRLIKGNTIIANDMLSTLEYYNKKGISLRYTFTNSLIDESMLNDYMGNTILALTKYNQKVKTGININKELLKDHIENKYKDDFYFLWSTTKDIKDVEKINALSENDLIVPSYDINNDFDMLSKLKYPENIELVCWEACVPNCKYRQEHYNNISKLQAFDINNGFICPYKRENIDYYEILGKQPHNITLKDMREKYLPLGINKFKISGRAEHPIYLVEHYVNFFVKDEYRDDIRLKLIRAIIKEVV